MTERAKLSFFHFYPTTLILKCKKLQNTLISNRSSLQIHRFATAATAGGVGTAGAPAALQLLLLKTIEISHGTVLPHRPLRFLISLYLRYLADPISQGLKFLELANLFGKQFLQLVNHFIYHEIDDSDIGEKPRIELSLLLVEDQYWFYFLLPVFGHARSLLRLTISLSFRAFHRDKCSPDVTLAADVVDLSFVFGALAEKFLSA